MVPVDGFRFASPSALLLLALVPIVAILWRYGASSAVLVGTVAPAAGAPATWRVRARPVLPALRGLAVVLLIVAIARPQAGEASSRTSSQGIDIVLTLDVSSSMSQTFARNRSRVDVAKDVLSQFVASRRNDRVGLVAFQSSVLRMSPLTKDYAAVEQEIAAADRLRLSDGTAIGVAIAEAVNELRDSTAASRVVILLTDGENNVSEIEPLAAARIAERLGVRVYTVGVVSAISSSRPDTASLEVDEASLKKIADVTGGTYGRAENADALAQIYQRIDALERSRLEGIRFTRYDEIAPYVLAAAAAALALELVLRHSLFRGIS